MENNPSMFETTNHFSDDVLPSMDHHLHRDFVGNFVICDIESPGNDQRD
jgi:hypothetical protein